MHKLTHLRKGEKCFNLKNIVSLAQAKSKKEKSEREESKQSEKQLLKDDDSDEDSDSDIDIDKKYGIDELLKDIGGNQDVNEEKTEDQHVTKTGRSNFAPMISQSESLQQSFQNSPSNSFVINPIHINQTNYGNYRNQILRQKQEIERLQHRKVFQHQHQMFQQNKLLLDSEVLSVENKRLLNLVKSLEALIDDK